MVRRSFVRGMTMANDQQVTGTAAPVRTDYTVRKGEVSLAVYHKRLPTAASEAPRQLRSSRTQVPEPTSCPELACEPSA